MPSVDVARHLLSSVQDQFDFYLVDSEKKIPASRYGARDAGNLEKAIYELVAPEKILKFRGNELTLLALNTLVSVLIPHLGGAKIALLGAGNLGFKIGLSLTEQGAYVGIYSSDLARAYLLSSYINQVKFSDTIAQSHVIHDLNKELSNVDAIIAATSRKNVVTPSFIESRLQQDRELPVLIDVGKFAFDIQGWKSVGVDVRYLDIEDAQKPFFYSLVMNRNRLSQKLSRTSVGRFHLVERGLAAAPGEYVIDSRSGGFRILGRCDRAGYLSYISAEEEREIWEAIMTFDQLPAGSTARVVNQTS